MACELNNGGIYQVSVRGRWNNVADVVNSYQLQLTAGGPLTLSDVRDDLVEYFAGLYDIVKDFCNAFMVFDDIVGSHLNGACSIGVSPFAAPIVGALTGEPYASGVAALVSFPTGVKRVTMRKYFGGLDEGIFNAQGQIGATAQGHLNSVVGYLVSPQVLTNGTWQFGYLSPKTAAFELPLAGQVSVIPAYQKRRRPGSGS